MNLIFGLKFEISFTSITEFSIKLVTGQFDGLRNFNSFLPRVTPAANSRLVSNSTKL